MRVPSDLPRPRRVPRGRPAIVVTVLILFVVLTSLRGTAGFWTDYLWFQQLGFGGVFTGILSAKFTLAVVFSAITFLVLLVNLIVADRIGPPRLTLAPQDEVVQRYREAVGSHTGAVRLVVALIFGVIIGVGQASQWNQWLLFHNAQSFGTKDPQFHRDIGFYVFKLPFEQNLVSWAFGAVLVITFITALFHYLNGGIRVQTPNPAQRVSPQVKAHLSLLLGILALIKGAGYYLQQYSLVLSTRGRVKGALYTDVHAQLPAFKLLMFISLIAFVLLIANIYLRGWTLPALGVGLWFLVSIAAGAIYPAIIQRYTVKPVENRKESTYIQRNIDATRAALNMTKVSVTDKPFAADANLTAQALQDNTQTVRNIRLWDPNASITPATYSQLQAIRGYYQFYNVNVDRYPLAGRLTQTEMSVRELNQNALPGGNSWVNEHLQYTHGFGAVLAPANAVTVDGQPKFDIRDIPPNTSDGPADTPQISQPRVYFGQQTTNFSIVGTKNDELDYESQTTAAPVTSHYDGKGGVTLSSLTRKAAFALRFSDLNVLISGSITPKSRILYVRDVADRIRKAAPFLKLDADPYAVITGPPNAQRILWVQDAYTTTAQYPYAQDFSEAGRLDARSGLNTPFNYVRNSVKATVDAYDGTVTFYVSDSTDPIVNAYRHAFPHLFKDSSQISPELRAHLRFPEDLFRIQTSMWGRYHITDAAAFYQAGDAWDVAADPGVGVGTSVTSSVPVVGPNGRVVVPSARRQDPFYLLMKLPNENTESFLMLQPMVAAAASQQGQQNLTAFMVAKSDAADYGQIEVFHMPEGQRVPGPTQIDSQIQQDPTVSKDISLLNTNGSQVLFGNILTIPVNQSLLYVRPLYVSSKGQGASIPQLKKVIVVYNNQVAYQNTLQESLDQLFPGATKLTQEQSTGTATPPAQTPPSGTQTPPPPKTTQTVAQLLAQAQTDFADANKALAKSPPDFATYEQKIQEAQALITQAAQVVAAANGSPSTTAPPATTSTTTQGA
ncbi:MAG: UPF0182 family protein [Acidimicrobiales bacterium]